ncbi:hypothetical protein [Actinophytocola sp.]|uniref:hypothetical protein n=1 Tax=Actinophytocola sp. TaxID=1872138 RepID=UPI00389B391C
MARLIRYLATPFGVAVLGLLVLAGWAAWSGGILDGAVARQVRGSSVYVAPGIDLDQRAAERVIGNRRLVVVFLDRDADLAEACEDTEDAAAGTLVVLFRPADDEFDHYGCAHFPGDDIDSDTFGKAFVAENIVPRGADQFLHRPLDAVKIVAVNYDSLVRSGTVPDGPRAISPSAPRYLLAAAAVLTVIGGAATVFLVSRRLGRLAAQRQGEHAATSDARASLNAKAAVLATHIIELDRRPTGEQRALAADYAELAAALTAEDPDPDLAKRVDALTERARNLTRAAARTRSAGRRKKVRP